MKNIYSDQIQFTTVNGKLEAVTPANTLITYYNEDMTVARMQTLKSIMQYYAAQTAARIKYELKDREYVIPAFERKQAY